MAEQLNQKRGRILGSLTKMLTYTTTATFEMEPLEKIEARLEKLEEFWAQFEDLEDRLALTQNYESKFDKFEDDYFNCKTMLLQQIKKKSPPVLNQGHNPNVGARDKTAFELLFDQQRTFFEHLSDRTTNMSFANNEAITIPKLQIEPFDGQYSKWQSFCDSFKSGVDNNVNLSDAHKFQLLKGYLRGDASTLLRHIPTTEDNYLSAWRKLEERYAKRKTILNDFLATFMNLPSAASNSVKGLRTLSDTTDSVIRGVKALGSDAERRDALMIYILLTKLDEATQESWAKETSTVDFPTIENFLKFINAICDAKEGCITTQRVRRSSAHIKSLTVEINHDCPVCHGEHSLSRCIQFRQFHINKRRELARQYKVCYNCLRQDHNVQKCTTKESCKICNRRHHTMLHYSDSNDVSLKVPESPSRKTKEYSMLTQEHNNSTDDIITSVDNTPIESTTILSTSVSTNHCVLLPTALVYIKNINGQIVIARALLDSGSQASLITESLAQTLRLPRKHSRVQITGLSDVNATTTRGCANVTIVSRLNQKTELDVNVLIVGKIASTIPTHRVLNSDIIHSIQQLELADPNFTVPANIDILLGADVFFKCLQPSTKSISDGITLQSSIFGWLITGIARNDKNIRSYSAKIEEKENIWNVLQQFWQVEEPPVKNQIPKPECELFYENTVTRSNEGRYIVRLPFKKETTPLGDSYKSAYKRLVAMERKFGRNPKFKSEYFKFMDDYENLHHMKKSNDHLVYPTVTRFYLPHHGVIKETSSTTKLRVVFDGSCKTSTGKSVNDNLEAGPILQNDLIDVVTRFRRYKIAFVGDIEKMYRQVMIAEEDRNMQMILWRKNPNEKPTHYKLCTVTYGMSSAAFLAVKTLHQLANDYQHQFPAACQALRENFYVDDILCGGENQEETKQLMVEVINVLKSGGFHLRKFKSNCEEILQILDESDRETVLPIKEREGVLTLGLQWHPQMDKFSYNPSPPPHGPITKRKVLSFLAKAFDPLGWISPVIIRFKMFFQKMWIHTKDWDELITDTLLTDWNKLTEDITNVSMCKIPRYIQLQSKMKSAQIHGFCDASELAFGAVVYLRVIDEFGEAHITMIISKSKVAPLKQISLPKLELCGAVLLSRLIKYTTEILKVKDDDINAWCDSKVVLAWLQGHPRQWKSFVGNRTSFISEHVPTRFWNYVKSAENPADLISRGLPAKDLIHNSLWWNGPPWLSLNKYNCARDITDYNTDDERRLQPQYLCFKLLISEENDTIDALFKYYSSFEKAKRVVARCLSWYYRGRHHEHLFNLNTKAEHVFIRRMQFISFKAELSHLLSDKPIDKTSKLLTLSPYLDENGVLRVGGRLINSSLSEHSKHPIIICHSHIIGHLIARDVHTKNFHAGPTLTTNLIRQKYWIINIRNIVRKIYHDCMRCARFNAKPLKQPMGSFSGFKEKNRDVITNAEFLLQHQIKFSFIPPRAPNFGGLWEANIKAVKFHLRRVVNAPLTFEDMSTILTQIEALLNSRPICPLRDDPTNLDVLTPGHFIIGEPLIQLPQEDVTQIPESRLSRFQHLQLRVQHFWRRWSLDYLNHLIQKSKWNVKGSTLKPDELVLIKDDNLPPSLWLLGRIQQVFYGDDGLIRVANIKTKAGVFRRAINKICKLPLDDEEEISK